MSNWMKRYGWKLLEATGQHIGYVVISVLAAAFLGIALAVLLSRFRKAAKVVMPLLSVFQTIPGIVFIGFLMFCFGMQPLTVIVALTIYAIFPILKNSYQGLLEVDQGCIEVANSCGMNRRQIFLNVELPLAMPAIFSGIRMSVIYTVGWAILAAMIGQGGLGEFIYRGIDANIKEYIVIGSIPIAILAVLMRLAVDWLEKKLVSKGLQI